MELCTKLPTVIAFVAPSWCGPCKRMMPSLDKLMKSEGTNYHVLEILDSDTSKNQFIDLFKVTGYPTIIIYFPLANQFVKFEVNFPNADDESKVEAFQLQINDFLIENYKRKNVSLVHKFKYNVLPWKHAPHFEKNGIKLITHNKKSPVVIHHSKTNDEDSPVVIHTGKHSSSEDAPVVIHAKPLHHSATKCEFTWKT